MAPEGGDGAVALSGSLDSIFTPVGEFLTVKCVLMLRNIPSILLYSPLSGNLAPRLANPDATPAIENGKTFVDFTVSMYCQNTVLLSLAEHKMIMHHTVSCALFF